MKAVFRVDASLSIGSGHVMRCLTLASLLAEAGCEVRFLCLELAGHQAEQIKAQGFSCQLLPGTEWVAEAVLPEQAQLQHAHQCQPYLADVDLLVIDHYCLSRPFEAALARAGLAVLVIDDLANRPHQGQWLLDSNPLPAHRYQGLVNSDCQLLCGAQYALLRPAFNALRRQGLKVRQRPDRLLVFCGGMDPDNISLDIATAIARHIEEGHPHQVDVVIGAANPHRAQLAEACTRWGFTLHVQTPKMAELMAAADLALGAGGSTHWERCMLGLPALVCTLAPNQQQATQALAERGACINLGPARQLTAAHWHQALSAISPQALAEMSQAAGAVLGAQDGSQAVADTLLSSQRKDR